MTDAEDTPLRRIVLDVFAQEIPNFDGAALGLNFDDLGLDSFDALTLRTAVERAVGRSISDDDWIACGCLQDILRVAQPGTMRGTALSGSPGVAGRRYMAGMPQLSEQGLSEGWLFREAGDFHWGLIAEGLGVSTADITDSSNHRLYATFSRLRLRTEGSLASFNEGDDLSLTGGLRRHGAGLFLGDFRLSGPRGAVTVSALSNFAYRDTDGSNAVLLRGQPAIPDGCPIPDLAELPLFAREYRQARHGGGPLQEAVAECEYRIVPQHDINGAGLLYFAAFPVIADICDWRIGGEVREALVTAERDIFYFANCDARETLRYRQHARDETAGSLHQISSLSRTSDNTLMALIHTTKVLP